MPTLAFVAALYDEVSRVVRGGRFAYERVLAPGGAMAFRRAGPEPGGYGVVVAATGWGPEAAAAGARWLVREFRPAAIVAAGYAGGLRPGLDAGAIVIAEDVIAIAVGAANAEGAPNDDGHDGRTGPQATTSPPGGSPSLIRCDEGLVRIARLSAQQARVPYAVGPMATTWNILCAASQKRGLGGRSGALAVDLETWHVGRAASEAGIPFLAVRTIVDTVDDDLPGFVEHLGPGPRPPATVPALRYLLRRPGSLRGIIRTGRAAGRARRTLAAFLEEFASRWEASQPGATERPVL
jgi:adenosylhomocysteine nucleosidase